MGGGLASLPTIAVQKVAITRIHTDSDLVSSGISSFPSLNKGGSKNKTQNVNGMFGVSSRCEGPNHNGDKTDDNKVTQMPNSHSSNSITAINEHRELDRVERDSLFVCKPRLDPLGMKLPLTPNGKPLIFSVPYANTINVHFIYIWLLPFIRLNVTLLFVTLTNIIILKVWHKLSTD